MGTNTLVPNIPLTIPPTLKAQHTALRPLTRRLLGVILRQPYPWTAPRASLLPSFPPSILSLEQPVHLHQITGRRNQSPSLPSLTAPGTPMLPMHLGIKMSIQPCALNHHQTPRAVIIRRGLRQIVRLTVRIQIQIRLRMVIHRINKANTRLTHSILNPLLDLQPLRMSLPRRPPFRGTPTPER
jgi:hypothetical protein